MACATYSISSRSVILCFLVGVFVTTTTIQAFSSVPSSWRTPQNRWCETLKNQNNILHPKSSHIVSSTTALVLSTIPYEHFPNDRPWTRLKEFSTVTARMWKQISEVTKWRIAAMTFISTIVLNRCYIDQHILQPLWHHLTSSSKCTIARIFRTDSYEWCLAIAAFTVIIHGYQYIDHQIHNANTKGIIHPLRKYRLQDRYLADKLRRQQLRRKMMTGRSHTSHENESSISMYDNDEIDSSKLVVQQSKWHVGAYFFELWVYALPLLTWDVLSPRRHRRLAAFGAPTTFQIMTDVTGSLLFYDFLFFIGHFIMHQIPILYRKFHAKHHITDEVRACDIVRLSFAEEVYDVGCSIVALNLLSAHPISRSIYNVIIVFLLTELHSGYDFPWTPQNVMPFNIASGSRRHHYHHRYGQHYYQKFFFTFDRIFGFFQKDDGTIKGDCIKADAYIPATWKAA
jgi:sterol desaturase/sphingolipid hydroxylase (fatty acid hydroxylase superfamily)